LLTLITGLIWLLDAKLFKPRRLAALARARASAGGELGEKAEEGLLRRIPFAETSESIFPVLAVVLVLRSFVYEPFQIPSGSMMPTLLVGDFILVEKFAYSLRDPVWRHEIVKLGEPKRGDVVVFKYPGDPTVDYIKRVIGLPGDRIIYRNHTRYVGKACSHGTPDCPEPVKIEAQFEAQGEFKFDNVPFNRLHENLLGVGHDILQMPFPDTNVYPSSRGQLEPNMWDVPAGHYFVMGDNRNKSADSRYWGFVPEANLVGKASAIWISFEFDDTRGPFSRWIPSGVRFNRVGGIQ